MRPVENIVIVGGSIAALLAAITVATKLRRLAINLRVFVVSGAEAGAVSLMASDIKFLESLGIKCDALIQLAGATADLGLCAQFMADDRSRIFNDIEIGQSFDGFYFNDLLCAAAGYGDTRTLENFAWYAHAKFNSASAALDICKKYNLPHGLTLAGDRYSHFLRQYCAALGVSIIAIDTLAELDIGICENKISSVKCSGITYPVDMFIDASASAVALTAIEDNDNVDVLTRLDHSLVVSSDTAELESLCFRRLVKNNSVLESVCRIGSRQYISRFKFDDAGSFFWQARKRAWIGNCVGIGEGVIHCPDFLLGQHFVLRHQLLSLLELWPSDTAMQTNATAYCRNHSGFYPGLFAIVALVMQGVGGFSFAQAFPEFMRRVVLYEKFGKIPLKDGDLLSRPLLHKLFDFSGVVQTSFDIRLKFLPELELKRFLDQLEQYELGGL